MTEYFWKTNKIIPVGGHKINVGGPVADFFTHADGLPISSAESSVKSLSNGHVQYKNLYFKRQLGQTGGTEIP